MNDVPAGIFPGGGGKHLRAPKICEGGGGSIYFFRQALKYAYRGTEGGV